MAVDEVRTHSVALPWSVAWARSAYGPGGFYTDGPGAVLGPGRFFRTSVHVGAAFARAVATLLLQVDARLGRPPRLDLVDVGAGRGELLRGILDALPPEVSARVRAVAVDVHGDPPGLDPRVTWVVGAAPDAMPRDIRGLVVAHEWLDDVPLDLVERDPTGRFRLVLVTADGREHLGPTIDDDIAWAAWGLDAARTRTWLARWWPAGLDARPGDRAEIGLPRDDAWRAVVARLTTGTALAVDYGHVRVRRPQSRPHPSLTAYRAGGRTARPVPDGTCNLTAHVAVDSLAEALGVDATVSLQHDALRALGVAATLPDRALASSDPAAYAVALEAASDASELLDPAGLGRFHWVRVDR